MEVAIPAAEHDTTAVGRDNVTREFLDPSCVSYILASKAGGDTYRIRLTNIVFGQSFMHVGMLIVWLVKAGLERGGSLTLSNTKSCARCKMQPHTADTTWTF